MMKMDQRSHILLIMTDQQRYDTIAALGYSHMETPNLDRLVNVGKMHTYPFETPMGFDERFVVENKDRYLEGRYFFDRWDMSLQAQGFVKQQRELYRKREDYDESLGAFEWKLPAHTQSDMFVGDLAKWWIEQKPLNAPLFMQIDFPGPHPPFDPVESYATS